jgi:hypothetical protein
MVMDAFVSWLILVKLVVVVDSPVVGDFVNNNHYYYYFDQNFDTKNIYFFLIQFYFIVFKIENTRN